MPNNPSSAHSKLSQLIGLGEKIAMLTCYDATFAKLSEAAGVDILLIGDSLGMVLQGADNTPKRYDARHDLPHALRGGGCAKHLADCRHASF